MIVALLLTLIALSVFEFLQHRLLRRVSPAERWFTYFVLLVAGTVFFFGQTVEDPFRPTVWLYHVLEPLNPIR